MSSIEGPSLESLEELCGAVLVQLQGSDSHDFSDVVWPDLSLTPLENLRTTFGLSQFETRLLLLALALELDTVEMLRLCAEQLGIDNKLAAYLTPFMVRRWLPPCPDGTDVSAFSPEGPLRKHGLLEVSSSGLGGGSDAMRGLRLGTGVLGFLLGCSQPSEDTEGLLVQVQPSNWLSSAQQTAVQELSGMLHAVMSDGEAVLINLYGASFESSQDIALNLGVEPMWLLQMSSLESYAVRRPNIAASLRRDLTLLGGMLIVHDDQPETNDLSEKSAESVNILSEIVSGISLPLVVISWEPTRLSTNRVSFSHSVPSPSGEELAELWQDLLPDLRSADAAALHKLQELVAQFAFSGGRIERLERQVHRKLSLAEKRHSPGQIVDLLWEECCEEGRRAFRGVADRLNSRATRKQLVLPEKDMATLDEIVTQVRLRHQVYRAWEIGEGQGGGITVLFSGISGGGKTFASKVLANELGLDLYRVDLSKVTSKWIGETEKNLRKIFDAADDGGAILLFDEADSVFGKRSATESSNDRYANMTTNYLLQRIEAYRGLAILTTNFESNIDSAFMRRIRFIINFSKPTFDMRSELWQRVFPVGVSTSELDYTELASWDLSGANIRDIAINATFMAEHRHTPVSMDILRDAIKRERRRLGHVSFDS